MILSEKQVGIRLPQYESLSIGLMIRRKWEKKQKQEKNFIQGTR
jgi:hypothetical protein